MTLPAEQLKTIGNQEFFNNFLKILLKILKIADVFLTTTIDVAGCKCVFAPLQ